MSKIIRMTPDYIEQIKREFAEAITKAKIADGKISFTRSFATTSQKARLLFTEKAWTKMQALIREFDKEVAWHGVAERGEGNDYVVSDILVYPQEVTGTNVEMDTEEYAKWIQAGILSGDERFDHFYFQGHSHVSMGVTPSSVDLNHQQEILEQLRDGGFYIFVIWNKRNEHNVRIYDLQKNTLFEPVDISVEVIEDEDGVEKFVRDAKSLVKNKPAYTGGYPGGSYFDRWQYPVAGEKGAPYNPMSAARPAIEAPKKEEQSKKTPSAEKKSGKGKTKAVAKPKSKVVAAAKPAAADPDDEDDPTSPFYVRDNIYGGYNHGYYDDDYWRE